MRCSWPCFRLLRWVAASIPATRSSFLLPQAVQEAPALQPQARLAAVPRKADQLEHRRPSASRDSRKYVLAPEISRAFRSATRKVFSTHATAPSLMPERLAAVERPPEAQAVRVRAEAAARHLSAEARGPRLEARQPADQLALAARLRRAARLAPRKEVRADRLRSACRATRLTVRLCADRISRASRSAITRACTTMHACVSLRLEPEDRLVRAEAQPEDQLEPAEALARADQRRFALPVAWPTVRSANAQASRLGWEKSAKLTAPVLDPAFAWTHPTADQLEVPLPSTSTTWMQTVMDGALALPC